mgnify:CR=1 FL=1
MGTRTSARSQLLKYTALANWTTERHISYLLHLNNSLGRSYVLDLLGNMILQKCIMKRNKEILRFLSCFVPGTTVRNGQGSTHMTEITGVTIDINPETYNLMCNCVDRRITLVCVVCFGIGDDDRYQRGRRWNPMSSLSLLMKESS